MNECQEWRSCDPAAWHGLEELREGLRSYLSRQCHDENDLDDVIQETLLRAARYRSCRPVQNLRPWALRIALNVLADTRRRTLRSESAREADALESVAEAEPDAREGMVRVGRWCVDGDAARVLLGSTLGEMRAGDRRLLDSFYSGANCTRAAALECGIPRHLVKVRLFRARRRLQRALRHRVSLQACWSALAS